MINKTMIFCALASVLILLAGCVSTVDDRTTAGVPLVKDKVEGRYERPLDQVFAAAKTVITRNGTLMNESTIYKQTDPVRTVQGKVNQVTVWVRMTAVEPNITAVTVQARTKGGTGDLVLAHEIDKQIALELVR